VASKEYKLIETVLANYKFLEEIVKMEVDFNNLKGVTYKHTSLDGHANNDSTQNEAFKRIERKNDLLKINVLLNYVKNAFNKLPDLENNTIRLYYLDGKNWDTVANNVHCSVRHCKRKRNAGIQTMSLYCYFDDIKSYYAAMSRLCPDYVPIMSRLCPDFGTHL